MFLKMYRVFLNHCEISNGAIPWVISSQKVYLNIYSKTPPGGDNVPIKLTYIAIYEYNSLFCDEGSLV